MDTLHDEIEQWIALLHGPGFQGREARDRAVSAMQRQWDRVLPILKQQLENSDEEVRCRAATAIMFVDCVGGVPTVAPLLRDPSEVVRWHVCGLMHDFGDGRAVELLIERLLSDSDAQVRVTAAWALGAIGDPRAVPALEKAGTNDEGVDQHGFYVSQSAVDAIVEIEKMAKVKVWSG